MVQSKTRWCDTLKLEPQTITAQEALTSLIVTHGQIRWYVFLWNCLYPRETHVRDSSKPIDVCLLGREPEYTHSQRRLGSHSTSSSLNSLDVATKSNGKWQRCGWGGLGVRLLCPQCDSYRTYTITSPSIRYTQLYTGRHRVRVLSNDIMLWNYKRMHN